MSSPEPPPYEWIDSDDALRALGDRLDGVKVVGIDTESDSMHSFFEKVCLVQVSIPGDEHFLVDPLAVTDMEPLRPALEDPDVQVILHGADYDIVCMKRDFGISIRGTFCTMTAGLILGLEKIGLGDLVNESYGVTLAKAFTRSDWSVRPLSEGQLEYLVQDVQYLIGLKERMEGKLAKADLVEEASIEFQRLEEREPAPREFDPWGFLRMKGSRDLPVKSKAVLRELVLYRDERARAQDRPAFKVVGNDTLLRIARERPRTMGRMRAIKGVSSYVARRHGDGLLDAVRKGLTSEEKIPEKVPPKPTAQNGDRRMNFASQKRHGRLKDWRKETAEATGKTPLAILPNHAMFLVAKSPPETVDELAALPGVGASRAKQYGEAILRLVGPRKKR
ncbi:MAG: ribonuclease D [Planctomycetota bacterium]